jgi:hypothetical protein
LGSTGRNRQHWKKSEVNRQRQLPAPDGRSSSYATALEYVIQLGKQQGHWKIDGFARDIGVSVRELYGYRKDIDLPSSSCHQKIKRRCASYGEFDELLDNAFKRAGTEPPVAGQPVAGTIRRLYLEQDEEHSNSANPRYVNAWLQATPQGSRPDGVLRVGFWASVRRTAADLPKLREVELRMVLPRGAAPSALLGKQAAYPFKGGVEIKLTGFSPARPAWVLRPTEQASTLSDRNLDTDEDVLIAVSDLAANQEINTQLVAYPTNFERGGEVDPVMRDLPLEKQAIIQALKLKKLGPKSEDGSIILVIMVDVVRESEECAR